MKGTPTHRFEGAFKAILFSLALVLALASFLYIRQTVADLRSRSRQYLELYANIYAQIPSTSQENFDFFFREFILKADFPLIITGTDGEVQMWQGIGVEIRGRPPRSSRASRRRRPRPSRRCHRPGCARRH